MAFRRDHDAGRQAVAWMAVACALVGGAGVCSFIILAFAEQPQNSFMVLGAILAAIILMLWSLGSSGEKKAVRQKLFFWANTQKPDPAEAYQPRRRRVRGQKLGGNQPPSVETVRDIAETHARWVPHGPAPRRDKPKRR